MRNISVIFLASALFVLGGLHSVEGRVLGVKGEWVKIVDKKSHYRVTLDYSAGSRFDVGAEYMELIQIIYPLYEANADGYLAELQFLSGYGYVPTMEQMILNAQQILPQVPQIYVEEIEGIQSKLTGGDIDMVGDGKLSRNEFLVLSLLPDVTRAYACSGVSFWGGNTRYGRTITGRNLDWNMGQAFNMNQIHAVTTLKDGDRSLVLVGFLGNLGMITGVNDDGVFGGILDSPVGAPAIKAEGKGSYYLELRWAMENYDDKEDVAAHMIDPQRQFTYNHNILLSDENESVVVENYMFGERSIRYDDSGLNPGVEWPFADSLGVVNSFLLEGKPDNHLTREKNIGRWQALTRQVENLRWPVRQRDVRAIMLYDEGPTTDHIFRGEEYMQDYGSGTLQQVIYLSGKKHLKVAFCPKDGPVEKPTFERIPLKFRKYSCDR